MILRCPDGDADGTTDQRDVVYIKAIEPDHSIVSASVTSLSYLVPRKSMSDARFFIRGFADLSLSTEFLDFQLNKLHQADLFVLGGVDCAASPNNAELILSAADFNTLVSDTTLEIDLIPSLAVGANRCGIDDFVTVSLTYEMARLGDLDGNGAVDVTDLLEMLASWGVCIDCFADLDLDGSVTVQDLLIMLANWGSNLPQP
jgi:hypothetical protein